MNKTNSYEETGILPVINIPNASLAISVADALRKGGINSIEVTLRSSDSLESIKRIKTEFPDMTVGAGTVLSTKLAESAAANGADFIVTPWYDDEVVDYCIEKNISVVPGCVTASEIQKAVKHGLKVLKFFPAELNGGIDAITSSCKNALDISLGFELAHIGINCNSEDEASSVAQTISQIFRLTPRYLNSAIFAGNAVEAVKSQGRGSNGHIGFYTNSINRAISYFVSKGIALDEANTKYNKNNEITCVYLKDEIGGFALHAVER